jgi:TonB family protein
MKKILLLFLFIPFFLQAQENTEDKVEKIVEEMPEFPGGMNELYKFLSSNLQYPKEDMKAGRQGKVIVFFIVEKDGSISNIRVDGGINNTETMNEEALRVVRLMPDWKPGKQRGKTVRVSMRLPVNFTLVESKKDKKKKK